MYARAALDQLVIATLFGSDFRPRHQITTNGLTSRARVSPDGKYAAFTEFVTGHSHTVADMSTATFLLDTATGANSSNVEEFETWKDGQLYEAPEFNFWVSRLLRVAIESTPRSKTVAEYIWRRTMLHPAS